MRIRLPPQLIIFALGLAFAMAVPGLPRRHDGPPSIAAGLPVSVEDGVPGWGERLDAHFPVGSSAETLVADLRQQGFEIQQHDELSRGEVITLASYAWRLDNWCHWMLGIEARSDSGGAVLDTIGEVRILCSGDSGSRLWLDAPGPLALPPPPSPF